MNVPELQADRPAVEVVNASGRSPIVLLCEHASSYIPARYARLGLTQEEALSHIAWDIGAEAVARHLAVLIDAPLFLATHSRLLVDLNRPTDVASVIPVRSEATDIPGNHDIPATQRAQRLTDLFAPFHDRIAAHLDERALQERPTRLLSLHSFTRTYLGVRRDCDIGVLFDRARDWAEMFLQGLAAPHDLNVAANEPYAISPDMDYAVPVHGDARGFDAILLEICNDLIVDQDGQQQMAKRIAHALSGA